jgi:hypothetical protein
VRAPGVPPQQHVAERCEAPDSQQRF